MRQAVTNTDSPLAQVLRGLAGRGNAQLDYLMYLFLQAVAVFVWWPKSTLSEMLQAGDGPNTLLAAVVTAGIAIAWFSARAGAQEVLLPAQRRLDEWASARSISPARVLAGALAGHLLLTLHLLALSSPLLLMAFTVSGGGWGALAWCLTAIVFQATFFHLAAATVYLYLGHHEAITLVLVRAIVVLTYLLTAVLAPAASHLVLSSRLLDSAPAAYGDGAPALFLLVYAALCALLLVPLAGRISRLRSASATAGA